MNGEQVPAESQATPSEATRGRSTIEFPYLDLDAAVEVVAAVHAVGGTNCDWSQLAGHMNQAPDGGGFRMRVMTARMFGLLEYERGNVTLSDLGLRVIDAKHSRAARADAFLQIPLYKAVFERLKNGLLPPPAAIERMMEGLGVAPKQKEKARQVFMRSAKQAGYFDINPDRLIPPPLGSRTAAEPVAEEQKPPQLGGGDDGFGSGLDPLIAGLVKRLPSPGSVWSIQARIKWLQAAANNFDLIFEADDHEKFHSIVISSTDGMEGSPMRK